MLLLLFTMRAGVSGPSFSRPSFSGPLFSGPSFSGPSFSGPSFYSSLPEKNDNTGNVLISACGVHSHSEDAEGSVVSSRNITPDGQQKKVYCFKNSSDDPKPLGASVKMGFFSETGRKIIIHGPYVKIQAGTAFQKLSPLIVGAGGGVLLIIILLIFLLSRKSDKSIPESAQESPERRPESANGFTDQTQMTAQGSAERKRESLQYQKDGQQAASRPRDINREQDADQNQEPDQNMEKSDTEAPEIISPRQENESRDYTPVTLRIELIEGNYTSPGNVFTLRRELLVGSDPSQCDIVFSQEDVSPRHARIYRNGDEIRIEDLGSDCGTYLYGMRLFSFNKLRDGDEVGIGDCGFTVRFSVSG